jgi:hypothetical protein
MAATSLDEPQKIEKADVNHGLAKVYKTSPPSEEKGETPWLHAHGRKAMMGLTADPPTAFGRVFPTVGRVLPVTD